MDEVKSYIESIFEDIKHIGENGVEFWYARELMKVLEYSQWRRFNDVINKAIESCRLSQNNFQDHFAEVGKKVKKS